MRTCNCFIEILLLTGGQLFIFISKD